MSIFRKLIDSIGPKTYVIPLDSFQEQFGNMTELEWKEVKVRNPAGGVSSYHTFPIDEIRCLNKDGEPFTLQVKPSIEIRITKLDGKKTVFYFDKIRVENGIIEGSQSKILKSMKTEIALENISKIEVQDGGKKFTYVD